MGLGKHSYYLCQDVNRPHTSIAILANRYCREAGGLSNTRPLSTPGWLDSVSSKPVKLTNPRASPQPTAMEKSPCVTKPRRTLEQWEVTTGRGPDHKPRVRGWCPAAGPPSARPSDAAQPRFCLFSSFFFSFCFRIWLLNGSLCLGSWGPQYSRSWLSWRRSSSAGTQIMVCGSGLPFLSRDNLTHTRALGKRSRMDRQASLLNSCCPLPGARGAARLSPEPGPHQADSCLRNFLLLHEVGDTRFEDILFKEKICS